MKLIIDIGNTNIVFGICSKDVFIHTWRAETKAENSVLFFEMLLRNQLLEHNIALDEINQAFISSVVPNLNSTIRSALESTSIYNIIELNPLIFKSMKMKIPKPDEIGSDLVANAFNAWTSHPLPAVVVDFGTALSFTIIDKQGINGVIICPGIQTSINALFSKTAKLPIVPLSYPTTVIGKDTVHAIQSGILIGYEGLIRHLLTKIDLELDQITFKIATGGLHSVIQPLEPDFDLLDINLTLNGLALLSNHLS